MTTASQLTKDATNAASPQSVTHTKCGIARMSRKKTVGRLRWRSAFRTTIRIERRSPGVTAATHAFCCPTADSASRAAILRSRTIARVDAPWLDRDDVELAARTLAGRLHRTPLLSS